MQLYWADFPGLLDVSLVVTSSIELSEEKKYAPAHPSVWEKEHQVEMNQGNWVPNVKVTSSQWT